MACAPAGESGTLRRVLVATPPNERRPGVAGGELCGFTTACSLLGLPLEFTLQVEAGFGGPRPATVARVEGRRDRLETGYRPHLQPILLCTLGRAGSTWVTQVVGAHPEALAYRPFDFEPRMLDYWMEIVRTLSHPHGYAQAIHPDVTGPRAWFEGRTRAMGPLFLDGDPAVERWVERDSIEELAAFAQRRVDSFYARVAQDQAKAGARRFVERAHEWHEVMLARELYEDARVVFLVRDLRDVLASRLAFNRKTGLRQFGADAAGDDEAYVRGAMREEAAALVQSWRAQEGSSFLLRYEDLVERPAETARALFAQVGLDAAAPTVEATLARAAARMPERQAGHGTTPDPAASIGRWRRDLDPALQAACAEAFGESLAAFGYEV